MRENETLDLNLESSARWAMMLISLYKFRICCSLVRCVSFSMYAVHALALIIILRQIFFKYLLTSFIILSFGRIILVDLLSNLPFLYLLFVHQTSNYRETKLLLILIQILMQ